MSATLLVPPTATLRGSGRSVSQVGGSVANTPEDARLRTYGTEIGTQVKKLGRTVVVLAAGVPNDVDLLAVDSFDGDTMVGTAAKLVYLEIIVKTQLAADVTWKRSAANAVELADGNTDSVPIWGRTILVDVKPSSDVIVAGAPAFDATHKQLTLTSTLGATVEVVMGVV